MRSSGARQKRFYPDPTRAEKQLRSIRRLRRFTRRLIAMALCVALVELIAFVFTSPRLRVQNVKVLGAQASVEMWSEKVMLAGMGSNIFRVNTGKLERALTTHPFIRSAEVTRHIPHGLVAIVRERVPYAVVRWDSGMSVMDSFLVPYRHVTAPDPALPMLDVPALGRPALGKTWSTSYLSAAVRTLEIARRLDLKPRSIAIDPSGDICLNTSTGVAIRAGSPQDIERKLRIAGRFLTSRTTASRNVLYVDVSCPGAPAFRPRTALKDRPLP